MRNRWSFDEKSRLEAASMIILTLVLVWRKWTKTKRRLSGKRLRRLRFHGLKRRRIDVRFEALDVLIECGDFMLPGFQPAR